MKRYAYLSGLFVFLILIGLPASIAENYEQEIIFEAREYGPDEFPLDELRVTDDDFTKVTFTIITHSYNDKKSDIEKLRTPIVNMSIRLRDDGLLYTSVKLIGDNDDGCVDGLVVLTHNDTDRRAWLQFLHEKRRYISECLHQPRQILPRY